ncbi:hypothetical protein IP70_21845 [alpha proteobacterium AAP38]|nr:hypothetical protein IP70_21845 [alpha proteobacterium AAP38]
MATSNGRLRGPPLISFFDLTLLVIKWRVFRSLVRSLTGTLSDLTKWSQETTVTLRVLREQSLSAVGQFSLEVTLVKESLLSPVQFLLNSISVLGDLRFATQ